MKYICNWVIFLIVTTAFFGLSISSSALAINKHPKLTKVHIGVGYIPNVQFSPLYVAQKKGFYAKVGLEVIIEYGFENDFVSLAAQGTREFAAASGDQVIMARSHGLPIVYIMKWYQRYPVAVMAPLSKNIHRMSDLIGKSVGIPGFYGSSYVGWKALVYSSKIDESQVDIKQIGYTQASAIQQNLVDAAVIYVVNEPIQLEEAGTPVSIIEVSDQMDLISNGLVVGEKLIKNNPDLVQRMVRASLRGLIYSIKHPDEAMNITRQVIPEITDQTAIIQRKVLDASIELWKTDYPGFSSEQSWQESIDFMYQTKLINKKMLPRKMFTNRFVESL